MRLALLLLAALSGTAFVQAQTLATKTYRTSGHPTEALATPDGEYVLVTVDRALGGAGLEIFRVTPKKLERVGFQELGGAGAQGILVIPHTHMLAVGMSNDGVAFLPLEDAIAAKAKPVLVPQGPKSGSGYLAVSPDGQFLFVANEYGDGGNIGVIALHPDAAGTVHPEALARIPTPNTTAGLTISPEGSRIYTAGEVVRGELAARLPGHGVAELENSNCVQNKAGQPRPNGALYAIDVARAIALPATASREEAHAAVLGEVDSGCSPVREAVSADGKVYATARGDNRVLVFDAAALEHNPSHALLQAIPSGGDAPVGLKLFAGGKRLLVANSNRFAGGPGNATVFDLTDPAHAKLLQTIPTGAFPRNITSSADGERFYLTIFNGDELMVLTAK
jgi:DNA-binding beta-propeller fold protein YncE